MSVVHKHELETLAKAHGLTYKGALRTNSGMSEPWQCVAGHEFKRSYNKMLKKPGCLLCQWTKKRREAADLKKAAQREKANARKKETQTARLLKIRLAKKATRGKIINSTLPKSAHCTIPYRLQMLESAREMNYVLLSVAPPHVYLEQIFAWVAPCGHEIRENVQSIINKRPCTACNANRLKLKRANATND